jgi:hypothetical protein
MMNRSEGFNRPSLTKHCLQIAASLRLTAQRFIVDPAAACAFS